MTFRFNNNNNNYYYSLTLYQHRFVCCSIKVCTIHSHRCEGRDYINSPSDSFDLQALYINKCIYLFFLSISLTTNTKCHIRLKGFCSFWTYMLELTSVISEVIDL